MKKLKNHTEPRQIHLGWHPLHDPMPDNATRLLERDLDLAKQSGEFGRTMPYGGVLVFASEGESLEQYRRRTQENGATT